VLNSHTLPTVAQKLTNIESKHVVLLVSFDAVQVISFQMQYQPMMHPVFDVHKDFCIKEFSFTLG